MLNDVLDTLKQHGQSHLAEHYEAIQDPKLKEQYLKQLQNIDYQQANQLYHHVYVEREKNLSQENQHFKPVPNITTHEDLKKEAKAFEDIGFEAIARGEVAVCIMSGGQGTRLGFDHPKGMFDLKLQCNLTLFGFFANRLARLNELVCKRHNKQGTLIKWYLMTSEMNHD